MLKRTEKSKANSRQKSKSQQQAEEQSQQQAEQQSQRQAGTANRRTANRDKVKYEEKHTTEEGGSQPVPDVQQGQYELQLGVRDPDHPKDQLRRGNRGVQERELSRQLRSSDTEDRENHTDQRS